jgi:hypothetical protein
VQLSRALSSVKNEFSQARRFVEAPVESDCVETEQLNLVDHRGLRAEEVPADRRVIASAQGDMEMEFRVGAHRNAPVEAEELVSIVHDRLLVSLRPKESNLEISEHPDSPEDGPALDRVFLRRTLDARKEIFAVGEFDQDSVALVPCLRRLTS